MIDPENLKIGKKYERLVVCGDSFMKQFKNSKRRVVPVKCLCKHDSEVKYVVYESLRDGRSASCGCLQKEHAKEHVKILSVNNIKHGQYRKRIYKCWIAMKARCYQKNTTNYKDYGGRGISVCDDWKHSFENFYKWASSNGYSDNLTIDRIDNDNNYCPNNCRWATDETQQNNKRDNRKVTAFGITMNIFQWVKSQYCTVKHEHLLYRINKGWEPEKAITTPIQKRFNNA